MTALRPLDSPLGSPSRPSLTRVPLPEVRLRSSDGPTPSWPGREIDVGGALVHIRETPGTGGTRAVFVHGLGGSATNWTELAALLAEGNSVPGLAVDLPGFGRSRPPANGDFSLIAQAEVVAGIIAAYGNEPVHLFGNSMGGTIALLLAAAAPHLVRSLTLVSPAMPDFRPSVRRLSDPRQVVAMVPVFGRSARRALAEVTARERAEQMLRLCFAEPNRMSAKHLALATDEEAERMALPWAGYALRAATFELFRSWRLPGSRSLWRVAQQVTAPTLVVWGAADKLVSVRKAPRTAESLPRGRLLVLPRTGHVAQMERPVTVARAVLGMWRAVDRGEW